MHVCGNLPNGAQALAMGDGEEDDDDDADNEVLNHVLELCKAWILIGGVKEYVQGQNIKLEASYIWLVDELYDRFDQVKAKGSTFRAKIRKMSIDAAMQSSSSSASEIQLGYVRSWERTTAVLKTIINVAIGPILNLNGLLSPHCATVERNHHHVHDGQSIGTNIEIILDVPRDDLQSLASDPVVAAAWVQTNMQAYPDVKFKYISVGNEADPNTYTSQYTGYVLLAMQNIHSAIVSAGLQDQIRVSTATYTGLLENTYPPSQGAFKGNVRSYIDPIIGFLVQHNLPLLVNVYPYFAYAGDTQISLEYALFTAPSPVVTDPDKNLQYKNLFDALLDSHYAALEKAGGPNVGIVVSESGWPSEGGTGASMDNAGMYYKNLIGHVKGVSGTPRKPNKALEAFLFAMFDENSKHGAETERHFGLFTLNQQSKYEITFN
ncbi:hypothetical protein LguiB_020500 [Lonicera macranthoides]